MTISNNPPFAILELTQEEHEFLLDNCDRNIEFALVNLQKIESHDLAMKMVMLAEKFKNIRNKLRKSN